MSESEMKTYSTKTPGRQTTTKPVASSALSKFINARNFFELFGPELSLYQTVDVE